MSSCSEEEPESTAHLTPEQLDMLRLEKIREKKLRIATLGSAIVSDPYVNVSRSSEVAQLLPFGFVHLCSFCLVCNLDLAMHDSVN